MRTICGTIHIVALAALAVGAAAGWFAAGACGNVETTNVGRARSPVSPERSEPRKRWRAPNGRACRSATAVDSRPRRRAPIRSSSESEVQKRILIGRVATLKKQLAIAKKMDEARKNSPSAHESGNAENAKIYEEETSSLKKHTGKVKQGSWTVGEMVKYAPTWFDHSVCRIAVDRACADMSRISDALSILDGVDVSRMTEEEKAIHERFANELVACSDKLQKWIDMVDTDETTWDEIWKGINGIYENVDESIAEAERDALRSMALRELGVAEGEADGFKEDRSRMNEAVKGLLKITDGQFWL